MEVDSSANTFGSSGRIMNIGIDGIALDTEYLKRNELVGKLQWLVSRSPIVLLSSPAASGKSSLFKLYQAANRNVEVLGISFLDERTPFTLLSEAGIDLQQKKISEIIAKK
jgi:predicted AAA+ superfamily ATPase